MNKLKQLRDALRMSQKEFADSLGITVRSLQYYEYGRDIPSKFVRQLYAKYKVNANWLILDVEEMFLQHFGNTKEDELCEAIRGYVEMMENLTTVTDSKAVLDEVRRNILSRIDEKIGLIIIKKMGGKK
jgi:transcriptional regulator with XRE-family HTH domain